MEVLLRGQRSSGMDDLAGARRRREGKTALSFRSCSVEDGQSREKIIERGAPERQDTGNKRPRFTGSSSSQVVDANHEYRRFWWQTWERKHVNERGRD